MSFSLFETISRRFNRRREIESLTGIAPLAWNIENGTAFSSGIIFCFYAGQSIAPLRKFFVIYQPFCDRPALLCLANRCTVSLFSFVVVPSMLRSFFPSIFFFFYRKYFRSKISPRFSTGEAFPYRQSSNDLQCCSINRYTANIYRPFGWMYFLLYLGRKSGLKSRS